MSVTPEARIEARTRRQAMEWSLVLASQGINPIIQAPTEGAGWALIVQEEEYQPAVQAIEHYKVENRGWAWRRELPGSNLAIHSGAIFWCLLLAAWHWMASFVHPELVGAGRMDGQAVLSGSYYRLFTPLLLHSDLAHLMANVTFGVIILGLAMARFGIGIALLTAYVAGGLANIPGIFLYPAPYRNVGASGMMMGALGLLCIHSFGIWRKYPKAARMLLSGVGAGVLIFVLFGLSPDSDVLAHLGGFVGGLFLGAILSLFPEKMLQAPVWNVVSLLVLAAAVITTWALALLT